MISNVRDGDFSSNWNHVKQSAVMEHLSGGNPVSFRMAVNRE